MACRSVAISPTRMVFSDCSIIAATCVRISPNCHTAKPASAAQNSNNGKAAIEPTTNSEVEKRHGSYSLLTKHVGIGQLGFATELTFDHMTQLCKTLC